MTRARVALGVAVVVLVATLQLAAVTRLKSADGQFWDIQDTSPWAQDSGGIATGGRANPFNGFGYLKLQVRRPDGLVLVRNRYLTGFGLAHDGAERFDSITPVLQGGVVVARGIYAPADTNYLRYFDRYTNVTGEDRVVEVAWGGAAGAFEDGGRVAVAATSSGDRRIEPGDAFVTVMQNARGSGDPVRGPSGHGPSAHVLGSENTKLLVSAGDMYRDPFSEPWPGYDPAHIGYVFRFRLAPGRSTALVTFVVKGLSEVYDPRGGFPVPIRNGMVAPQFEAVYSGPNAAIPAAGTEIARVTAVARQLVAKPDFRGLTPRELGEIANWPASGRAPAPAFTVFEQTADRLQDALTGGLVTAVDIVREYLTRLAAYDRSGPTFRAMLAFNPRAIADARALDAERAAGRVRGPFHGVPIAFKDNIDVLGLPTTGGSRALADHRPRLDSYMAARMRRAGAIVLGKTNLDEFPFGDFGISTVGGTIGNAYDPSLSTAGSSGGSAVAVAASLVTLAFGTDTCNSLSNPAAFASLATIRTTRGLTSRAGVMPLNPYNDAVGPMAKSVRELADCTRPGGGQRRGGSRSPATRAVTSRVRSPPRSSRQAWRVRGSASCGSGSSAVTREREAATLMARVVKELEAAGAVVVDVEIADLDDQYRAARGSAPGSLAAAWRAYLSRGAAPGDKVLTIEDLIASGKLAPGGLRRFETALQPTPSGAALAEANRRFVASREAFRDVFVDLMDAQRLDALIYPANLARPHTHEGGEQRYGSEPGTCEESAMTGLPQVTVSGGFMRGGYPFGVSFLGRPWSDGKLLGLAYRYEQATHHRRPPGTVAK